MTNPSKTNDWGKLAGRLVFKEAVNQSNHIATESICVLPRLSLLHCFQMLL